jgi:hypothetical protein
MAVATLGLLAIAASPDAARAGHARQSDTSPPASAEAERQLRAAETATLGASHAADHAAQRAVARRATRRWRRMSPAKRRRALRRRRARAQAFAQATAKDPATEIGRWTHGPFALPTYAIHLAVLPTGKMLFWSHPPKPPGGGQRPNVGTAAIWDPSKGYGPASMKNVPPPSIDVDGDGDTEPATIFCSGQSFLPNGTLLLTGGNRAYEGDPGFIYSAGHNRVFTFDPWTESWTEQPAMRGGRWYPTQLLLGDGRTLILGGLEEDQPGGVYNPDLEVFFPAPSRSGIGSLRHEPSGDRVTGLYPRLFTLPNGDVLLAGPDPGDSAILRVGSLTWEDLPPFSRYREGGSVVMMPSGPAGASTAVQFGGFDRNRDQEPDGNYPAVAASESLDGLSPSPAPAGGPSFHYGRSYHNVIVLPDGSMVAFGGARGYSDADKLAGVHADGRLRRVEVFDRATGAWKLGPAQLENRTYHSTAVLLPSGRVMSAGDDTHPLGPGGAFSTSDTAEIYTPPYLFRKGKRPKIRRVRPAIKWGQKFGIKSRSRKLKRAVLMAPAATTHSLDMNQHRLPLKVVRRSKGVGITVRAPASRLIAPPGYYMIFLLNRRGEPSKARWVRLGA